MTLVVDLCEAMGLDAEKVLKIEITADFRGVRAHIYLADPNGILDVDWRQAEYDWECEPRTGDSE